jgi:hypothetical protein
MISWGFSEVEVTSQGRRTLSYSGAVVNTSAGTFGRRSGAVGRGCGSTTWALRSGT